MSDSLSSITDAALDPAHYGLFDTVIGGPAAVPFAVGWALLGLGFVWSLTENQLNAMRGKPKPHADVVVNVAIHAALLGSYTFIAKWLWLGTQSIALSIYPESKLTALLGMLKELAARFQSYTFTFSIANVAQGIKDSMVSAAAMSSMVLALVSHYQIQQVQAGVYNVVFIFGPLLIGAGAFGLPTARIWFMAMLEVSSWSISAATLYYGLSTTFKTYLAQTSTATSLLDSRFLDAINALIFLSTAMIIVPIITGRLLGSATLGELSHAQASGTTWAARIGSWVSSAQSTDAPRADSVRHAAAVAPAHQQRPGD
jgi:hypothetical protein